MPFDCTSSCSLLFSYFFLKIWQNIKIQAKLLTIFVGKVTYLLSKSVTQMIENLGEVVERYCLASPGNKKFALLSEESTYLANMSELAIYLRWNDSGIVSDHFMELVEMDRTRAEDSMRAIKTFSSLKGLTKHQNSSQTSDDSVGKVTYFLSKSVTQMIENLGKVVERYCLASLGNKKFALLSDESTD